MTWKGLKILLLESAYLPQIQNALRKNELFYRQPSAMWRSASATRNDLKILLLESVYLPQAQNALKKNKLFYRWPSAMWRSASATRNGFKYFSSKVCICLKPKAR
ncbi:hypothetical protein T235_14840 [Tannerella sp. oral taxon BU063 isolate Cell 8/11]|uniref:Uncharacterized protein n=1 Tax=Tannerella sp. oral taxon BU063 isolate Cell 8/11 TaxID=1411915 RepID=W2CYP7_9BACT|nr:hypothetical protein T235_14840 [Tannerella sp. oral taxon BU063 isolate Cell 8/11]